MLSLIDDRERRHTGTPQICPWTIEMRTSEQFGAITHPNVLVAHVKSGLEVIHFYRQNTDQGTTHARLARRHQRRQRHRPRARRRTAGRGARRRGEAGQARVAACYAFVSMGIPTTGDLFNGTICNPGGSSFTRGGGEQDDSPLSMEQIDAMFEGSVDSEVLDQTAPAMEVVTPMLIRSYGVRGGSGGAVNRATGAAFSWDSVFLTSDGHVTSYGADGRRQWVSATPASWRPSDNRLDSDGTASLNVGAQTLDVDASVLPTLAVFSPVPHEEEDFVLAAGSQQLAILTSDGEVQHTIALPDFPTAPVNVGMDLTRTDSTMSLCAFRFSCCPWVRYWLRLSSCPPAALPLAGANKTRAS